MKSNGTGIINNLFQFETTIFKVIPFESNPFSHSYLPRFYALLEGFFSDASYLRRFWGLTILLKYNKVKYCTIVSLKNGFVENNIRGAYDKFPDVFVRAFKIVVDS